MPKGSRLFYKLTTVNEENSKRTFKKGRNDNLIADRNECLIYRYYYYAKVQRLRYSDVLEKMCKEFYLCERTVIDITQTKIELMNNVFSEKPQLKILKTKYNHLNWTSKNLL